MAASAPADHEIIGGWYRPSPSIQSKSAPLLRWRLEQTLLNANENRSLIDEAFAEAKIKICSSLSQGKKKVDFVGSKQSLQEIQDTALQSMKYYQGRNSASQARKWLHNFSQRVMFYADVLDVLVQHHPEFVALAWGGMKFLLVV